MTTAKTQQKPRHRKTSHSLTLTTTPRNPSFGFIRDTPHKNGSYKSLIAKNLAQKKGKQSVALAVERKNLEWERKFHQLLQDNHKLEQQIESINQSKRKMQMHFDQKEATYREEIDQLNLLTQDQVHHLKDLHSMHKEILTNVSSSQHYAKNLVEQSNKSLIVGYENEINHLKGEIENMKLKQKSGNDEFESKTKELQQENTWLKQIATTIEKDNSRLKNENIDYMQQISTLESDREFLINQVIAVKRENKHLQILAADHSNTKSINHRMHQMNNSSSNATVLTSSMLDEQTSTIEFSESVGCSSRSRIHSQSVRQTPLKNSRKPLSRLRLSRPQSAISRKTDNQSCTTARNTTIQPASVAIDPKQSPLNSTRHYETRQTALIENLQKQLETEKKRAKNLEYVLNKERASKSDLQSFLQQFSLYTTSLL